MPSYNLLDEKWISCILPDGETAEFGLKEVLLNSHKIKEVLDVSPLVTVSLYRLLLAILHKNFGPSTFAKWQDLWNKRKWDEKVLRDYFSQWHYRFYLLDDERPFYQSKEVNDAKSHPIGHLAIEVASGNNATLFDHNIDSDYCAVPPAIAARYVITAQAYAIGGGVSTPFNLSDAPLTRGFTTMILGTTLFDTLALNLLTYNKESPFPSSAGDCPVWEQNNLAVPDKDGSPIIGYIDYLTWQSRRIRVFGEGDEQVDSCFIQQNLKLPNQIYFDPFKTYRRDKEKGLLPRKVDPEKAVWRDSHILFQTVNTDFKRPEVINWMARIDEARITGTIQAETVYRLMITGLATESGKAASVLLWRHERLPLPVPYLQDEDLINTLKEALRFAEDVGSFFVSGYIKVEVTLKTGAQRILSLPSPLRILASELLPKDQNGKTDPESTKKLADSLSPSGSYWASLGIVFPRFMAQLAEDQSNDKMDSKQQWAEEVRAAARNAFNETSRNMDRSARSLRAISKAENVFNSHLSSTLKSYLNNSEEGGENE